MKDVIVKYFSSKSLSTIDMNFFFKVIFDKFGDSKAIVETCKNCMITWPKGGELK